MTLHTYSSIAPAGQPTIIHFWESADNAWTVSGIVFARRFDADAFSLLLAVEHAARLDATNLNFRNSSIYHIDPSRLLPGVARNYFEDAVNLAVERGILIACRHVDIQHNKARTVPRGTK
jgi:hypothetical protein